MHADLHEQGTQVNIMVDHDDASAATATSLKHNCNIAQAQLQHCSSTAAKRR